MYGIGKNEVLVGKAIRGRRSQVVLATKFGNVGQPVITVQVTSEMTAEQVWKAATSKDD